MNEVIDDKWAAVWPRRWVMVRDADSDPWRGPYRLLGRAVYCSWEYVTDRGPFGQCRPATPEEIVTVEPATASTKQPDPGPGWRIAGDDDYKDLRCEWFRNYSKRWGPRDCPGEPFNTSEFYRIPIDEPQPNEQIAVKEPKPSDEMARYLEIKRLAEMAWVAILPEECAADAAPSNVADAAWAYAEFMLIESERRRPKQ